MIPETISQPRMPNQLRHVNDVRTAERETRCADAWTLRLEGLTVREISEKLNVSVGTVSDYLRSVLEDLKAGSHDGAETWRRLELDRLDAVLKAWLPVAQTPTDPEAARGAAIVIRSIEAQARLLGLLQPTIEAPASAPETPSEERESFEDSLVRSPALRADIREQLEEAEKKAAALA